MITLKPDFEGKYLYGESACLKLGGRPLTSQLWLYQPVLLAAGHGRQVLPQPHQYHRNLKPKNLLLDACGDLKVSNFGFSALQDASAHRARPQHRRHRPKW